MSVIGLPVNRINLETISRIDENGDMTIYKGEVDVSGKKCGKGILKYPEKNDQSSWSEGTWFDDKPHGLMH